MEKAGSRHYHRYDQYHAQGTQLKNNNQKTATLKRGSGATATAAAGTAGSSPGDGDAQESRCFCAAGARSSAAYGLAQGVFSNLGICALLIGYTLLGSFVFVMIESEGSAKLQPQQRAAGTALAAGGSNSTGLALAAGFYERVNRERAETVERIWDITVSLNILYRDNWTRLAALEIARFQDELLLRLQEEMAAQQAAAAGRRDLRAQPPYEWDFPRAFLYSLTVLTTIGYGSIAPRTVWGKAVTMLYAVFGIPLMLIYLSSVGSLLSRCVRATFSRTLCCLCASCGYCCYDEKRMQERERRLKKKRQQLELQQQQQQQQLQEPFYVRSASSVTGFTTSASSTHNNLHSPARDGDVLKLQQPSLLSDAEFGAGSADDLKGSSGRGTSGSLATPIALCLGLMLLYVCGGAAALVRLEKWTFLDGCYFCFMSLSTIGFGDLIPGGGAALGGGPGAGGAGTGAGAVSGGAGPTVAAGPPGAKPARNFFSGGGGNGTVWFCSVYILTGMALTAMCFNILHDEIVHRLKHQATQLARDKDSKGSSTSNFLEDTSTGADPYGPS